MSEQQDPTGESLEDRDRQLFDLLEEYVNSLHRDDVPTRSGLFKRHPELAELLECLEALDCLATVPSSFAPSPGDGESLHKAITIVDDPLSAKDDTPSEEEAGRDFGKYRLLEEIGRGGMGVVYRAQQIDLDRTVALKMILSSRLASDNEVRRFYAEAKAAGSLRHPNIVGIHEVGQIHGQHYFAMDHVEGQSLATLLRDGRTTPEMSARCLVSVARAVHYLHEHNIVHRDLKPSNILLDDEGTPYVTDFGLAKVFDSDSRQTQTGTIIGTPSYMAPEQAAGRPSDVAPQSDVYSLGAILYEMLTGRPPFQRNSPLDTLVDVLEGEPANPSTLNRETPRELELICLRCLEKDPGKRYQSAEALADDLEHFLKREPIDARPRGLGSVLKRWGRREPALVSRLGALLVAASIVQVNYMFNGVDYYFHLKIMSIFAIWAVVSFVFQRMLHRERLAGVTRFLWAAADAALLTLMIDLADGPRGPLLIGYPLLVCAAGLFFRVRLVLFMTFVSLVAYSVLVVLHGEEANPPHYPVIFAFVLAVLGIIVAYQVYRVRTLSRYYDQRRIP